MNPNDGGPAFPTKRETLDPRAIGWSMQDGMSLRDWFAGMALQGLCTQDESHFENALDLAETAFQAADAMLEARQLQK